MSKEAAYDEAAAAQSFENQLSAIAGSEQSGSYEAPQEEREAADAVGEEGEEASEDVPYYLDPLADREDPRYLDSYPERKLLHVAKQNGWKEGGRLDAKAFMRDRLHRLPTQKRLFQDLLSQNEKLQQQLNAIDRRATEREYKERQTETRSRVQNLEAQIKHATEIGDTDAALALAREYAKLAPLQEERPPEQPQRQEAPYTQEDSNYFDGVVAANPALQDPQSKEHELFSRELREAVAQGAPVRYAINQALRIMRSETPEIKRESGIYNGSRAPRNGNYAATSDPYDADASRAWAEAVQMFGFKADDRKERDAYIKIYKERRAKR